MNIELTSQAKAVLQKLEAMPASMQREVASAIDEQNDATVSYAQSRYMTGPRPQKLGVVTNRLRSSLNATPARIIGDETVSSIGTNVSYAGAHEHGLKGMVTVREHSRRIFAKRAGKNTSRVEEKTAIFDMKTGLIKRYKKQIRNVRTSVTVRAHERKANLVARPFLAPAVEDRAGQYRNAISRAIVRAWNSNKGT